MKFYLYAIITVFIFAMFMPLPLQSQTKSRDSYSLDKNGCLKAESVWVLTYQNKYYPGHRSGIEFIQNGSRIISSMDLRIDPIPIPDGLGVEYPEFQSRETDPATGQVTMNISYPAYNLEYKLKLKPEGNSIRFTAELDEALKAGQPLYAMLEIYPVDYFGRTWMLDGSQGIFPRQYNGKRTIDAVGDTVSLPLATGRKLSVAPGDKLKHFTVESHSGDLELHDGRASTNHKWFVVMEKLPAGKKGIVAEWIITPGNEPSYHTSPVIGISQTGYHPLAEKSVVIETDPEADIPGAYTVQKVGPGGEWTEIKSGKAEKYGLYLNKSYYTVDLTSLQDDGLYVFTLDGKYSEQFMIDADAYSENLWKTTLGTFLPVQMCHMKVKDRIRLWHLECHMDDAVRAPLGYRNWLGYYQDPDQPYEHDALEHIDGLAGGGWHDAGDFQMPTASNAATVYNLSLAFEEFKPLLDETSIDEGKHEVIMHTPDGVPDMVQQIAHGTEYILTGYRNNGYAYAGVIAGSWLRYLELGEADNKTDNKIDELTGNGEYHDDRFVFTERNKNLEYFMAAVLASAYRSLKQYYPGLAAECLRYATVAYNNGVNFSWEAPGSYIPGSTQNQAVQAAVELFLTTGSKSYIDDIAALLKEDGNRLVYSAPALCRLRKTSQYQRLETLIIPLLNTYRERLQKRLDNNPYGAPLGRSLFGLGYYSMGLAKDQYYLHKYYPEKFSAKPVFDILNYMTGVHPANNLSLVTGIGSNSKTSAFGFNRSDYSYIPGGVISGPAWMNPGFFELKENDPFLWIQTEYTIGGASSFIFVANAAQSLMHDPVQVIWSLIKTKVADG